MRCSGSASHFALNNLEFGWLWSIRDADLDVSQIETQPSAGDNTIPHPIVGNTVFNHIIINGFLIAKASLTDWWCSVQPSGAHSRGVSENHAAARRCCVQYHIDFSCHLSAQWTTVYVNAYTILHIARFFRSYVNCLDHNYVQIRKNANEGKLQRNKMSCSK